MHLGETCIKLFSRAAVRDEHINNHIFKIPTLQLYFLNMVKIASLVDIIECLRECENRLYDDNSNFWMKYR